MAHCAVLFCHDARQARMHESIHDQVKEVLNASTICPLFLWRGSGIVLIGEREEGRWILARGWLHGDRLEYVRRWSFAQPIPFSGQVRRLVMEAGGDVERARVEGSRALAWTESLASAF
jgi:hypothetical protein